MQRQTSFADVEYDSHRVTTRKERFLGQMDGLVPWDEWCALTAPFWHPAEGRRRGRRPVNVINFARAECGAFRQRRLYSRRGLPASDSGSLRRVSEGPLVSVGALAGAA